MFDTDDKNLFLIMVNPSRVISSFQLLRPSLTIVITLTLHLT